MKALTVRQPWAQLIVAGIKRIENRSWMTRHRGRLWIHASQSAPEIKNWRDVLEVRKGDGAVEFKDRITLPPVGELPRGVILGCVEVIGCHELDDLPEERQDDPFACGPWCWLLACAQLLTQPVSVKGACSLWNVPESLLKTLRAAVGPA